MMIFVAEFTNHKKNISRAFFDSPIKEYVENNIYEQIEKNRKDIVFSSVNGEIVYYRNFYFALYTIDQWIEKQNIVKVDEDTVV